MKLQLGWKETVKSMGGEWDVLALCLRAFIVLYPVMTVRFCVSLQIWMAAA